MRMLIDSQRPRTHQQPRYPSLRSPLSFPQRCFSVTWVLTPREKEGKRIEYKIDRWNILDEIDDVRIQKNVKISLYSGGGGTCDTW
jgi:hypothetical protein